VEEKIHMEVNLLS